MGDSMLSSTAHFSVSVALWQATWELGDFSTYFLKYVAELYRLHLHVN